MMAGGEACDHFQCPHGSACRRPHSEGKRRGLWRLDGRRVRNRKYADLRLAFRACITSAGIQSRGSSSSRTFQHRNVLFCQRRGPPFDYHFSFPVRELRDHRKPLVWTRNGVMEQCARCNGPRGILKTALQILRTWRQHIKKHGCIVGTASALGENFGGHLDSCPSRRFRVRPNVQIRVVGLALELIAYGDRAILCLRSSFADVKSGRDSISP